MANIREVALKAGVAPSTVSFVLNNKDCVAAETRVRVEEALHDLRYIRRKGGRPVRGVTASPLPRRKNQIAFLFPQEMAVLHRISTFMMAVHAIESTLTQQGVSLVIRHVPADLPASTFNLATKIDGALFIQDEQPLPLKRVISNQPAVRIFGVAEDSDPWDHVTYDIQMIGKLAAEYLLSRGHKHCAYLSPHAGVPLSQAKAFARISVIHERVFCNTVAEGGGEARVNSLGVPGWLPDSPDIFVGILAELFKRPPVPTALFVPADGLTARVYPLLQSMGIRPGVDVEVVSCNNEVNIMTAGLHPRPAVIDLHAEAIGIMGIRQLYTRMTHPELPRSLTLLRPHLILPPAEAPV